MLPSRRKNVGIVSKMALTLAMAVGFLLTSGLLLHRSHPTASTDESVPADSLDSTTGTGSGRSEGSRFRQIRQLPPERPIEDSQSVRPQVRLQLWTGGFTALSVDDVLLVNQSTPGLHVFILNQATASLMGHRILSDLEEAAAVVNDVASGRILAMAASNGHQVDGSDCGSAALAAQGGRLLYKLRPGWPWALVSLAKIGRLAEKLSPSPTQSLVVETAISLTVDDGLPCPSWPAGQETLRRRRFCSLVDGFSSNVCSCESPARISFGSAANLWIPPESAPPITVMSDNRPQLLFRTLTSLLSAESMNASHTRVLLRGFFEEPRLVCDLLQLPSSSRRPASGSLAELYRLGLADTFQLYPSAKYVILLEDGVALSNDVIQYFNWTLRLMDTDPNLFCVSAWNDQSGLHTSRDPGIVHRVQRVPLKALALRRSVWDEELNHRWPEEKNVDLSGWLTRAMGPGRYCLRPALSRVTRLDAPSYNFQLPLAAQLRDTWARAAGAAEERHYSHGRFRLDEGAHWQYDSELQRLISRSHPLGPSFSLGCESALKIVEDAIASYGRSRGRRSPPVFLLMTSASEAEAASLWRRVSACFLLGPSPSCLYKGICRVDFEYFVLLLGFREAFLHFRFPQTGAS